MTIYKAKDLQNLGLEVRAEKKEIEDIKTEWCLLSAQMTRDKADKMTDAQVLGVKGINVYMDFWY